MKLPTHLSPSTSVLSRCAFDAARRARPAGPRLQLGRGGGPTFDLVHGGALLVPAGHSCAGGLSSAAPTLQSPQPAVLQIVVCRWVRPPSCPRRHHTPRSHCLHTPPEGRPYHCPNAMVHTPPYRMRHGMACREAPSALDNDRLNSRRQPPPRTAGGMDGGRGTGASDGQRAGRPAAR